MNNNEIATVINNYIGFQTAGKPSEIEAGKIHICDLPTQYLITCVESDIVYIEAISQLVSKPVKIISGPVTSNAMPRRRAKGRKSPPRGKGFGDKAWRRNAQHKGVEISFTNKPSDEMRATLKGNGFRWAPMPGVWYISEAKLTSEIRAFIAANFREVESV